MSDDMLDTDHITVNNWRPMLKVRKKPIVVHATRIYMPFKVTTEEGVMHGRSGDYLMIGVHGEKYPIKREIFEETVDVIGWKEGENEC